MEYVFISSNSWFLGKLKTVKTTLMILPRRLISQIEEQGRRLELGITDPLDAAAGGAADIQKWKRTAARAGTTQIFPSISLFPQFFCVVVSKLIKDGHLK